MVINPIALFMSKAARYILTNIAELMIFMTLFGSWETYHPLHMGFLTVLLVINHIDKPTKLWPNIHHRKTDQEYQAH
jgi:hypothetical protein